MPKHHLEGYDDKEIIRNLKYCLAWMRRGNSRRVITSITLVGEYNKHFQEVPKWYLRSFVCLPHFRFQDPIGWTIGC